MESVACPLCGGTASSEFLRVPDSLGISSDTFTLARCYGCTMVYLDPRPSAEEMDRFYPSGYCWREQGSGLAASMAEGYRRLILRIELAFLAKHLPAPGRMLDVGCGSGDYLQLFRERGWQAAGVESAGPAAEYAAGVRGLEVRRGDLASARFPGDSFDLVTFFQVMEHVPDPRAQVRESFRILKPGGSLLVQVPNIGSAQFRRFREKWLHLSAPQHLSHFSPATLRALLESEGFRITAERQLSVRMDPLVDVVSRHPGMRPCVFPGLGGGCGPHTKALFLLLTLAALPAAWAEARAGEGATLAVVAEKPAAPKALRQK